MIYLGPFPDVDGYVKFINNDNRGCANSMTKDGVVNLGECKKKCDNTPECKFFSIDEKSCRTHKLCNQNDVKETDKFRTTYERKSGKICRRVKIRNISYIYLLKFFGFNSTNIFSKLQKDTASYSMHQSVDG